MDGLALGFSLIAAVVAIYAVRAANRSADEAELSRKEAEKANHHATTPGIEIATDGRTHAPGLQFTLTCDRDLTRLHVSLVKSSMSEDENQRIFSGLFRQGSGVGDVELLDVKAGQTHVLYADLHPIRAGQDLPSQGQVNLRCVCTVDDEEWVVPATTGLVDLKHYHWDWR